jgi:hypothetical protein
LEYQAFNTYLENLPKQNKQLKDKEILKISDVSDEYILALGAYN